jgi:NAD(P)-dependent dehydrogenase (short-subunit alcohol dehydrogenase family)
VDPTDDPTLGANLMPRKVQETPIPDQSGRLAVVTGASDGIGLAIATRLAGAGAEIVMPVRDQSKGAAAAEQILSRFPTASVSVRQLDLASMRSVADFSAELLAESRPVHILINNAGVMTPPERLVTEDGFELQFATNHLGHFALTTGILPLLRAGHARVVSQTSIASKKNGVQWDDLQSERGYHAMRAYSSSKTALALFGVELDRRSRAAGWGVTSMVTHPGVAPTNLLAPHPEMGRPNLPFSRRVIGALSARGILVGNLQSASAPALFAATDPEAQGGKFYGPSRAGQLSGPPVALDLYKPMADPADGARIWDLSEGISGKFKV